HCVSLSTTEAELIALSQTVSEGLWFKKLLADFDIRIDCVMFYEDNQGCISVIQNPANNRRIKHIDLKYQFITDNLKKGNINVQYICTDDQQADLLTKGLNFVRLNILRGLIGLRDFSAREDVVVTLKNSLN
ncbi:unnamed protein product, partial [Psylliodes chrysocephalus]